MFARLRSDIQCILERDPADRSTWEVLTCYPGLHALILHRRAHWCWNHGLKWLGRFISHLSRGLTGIEIHPGATIGNGVMLDHASGVVIGATAIVGSDVYMLHGVTLGATGKPTFGAKRHPTIGSSVILGAGAAVLGDITVADGCTVGAGAIVTKDVPPGSTVVGINKLLERPVVMNEQPRKADDGAEPSATARQPAGLQASRSGTNADDYTWLYSI
jgi:serine O-acetyltransferase